MIKEELFEKYNINESHNVWDNNIDNWIGVEIFRIMHNGKLPKNEDTDVKYITDFLDKINSDTKFMLKMRNRDDFGSLYLTAKRSIYSFANELCGVDG